MHVWRSTSEHETRAVGRQVVDEEGPGATILLFGDLGAGKTTLVQGIAEGLGIDRGRVQSPSYTLIHEYREGDTLLVHIDLYRLEPAEVLGIGIEEVLAGPGLKVVEWAERLPVPVDDAIRLELGRSPGSEDRVIKQVS